jgi:hypothetical protein
VLTRAVASFSDTAVVQASFISSAPRMKQCLFQIPPANAALPQFLNLVETQRVASIHVQYLTSFF